MKSKSILPLVVTSEITIFIFTVSKNGFFFFFFFFVNSGLKVLPKGLKCSILSEITVRTLTFHGGTGDVTYCADVTFFCFFFLHATSGGLSLTAAFSLCRFLAFYYFKCCLASFFRYITAFT